MLIFILLYEKKTLVPPDIVDFLIERARYEEAAVLLLWVSPKKDLPEYIRVLRKLQCDSGRKIRITQKGTLTQSETHPNDVAYYVNLLGYESFIEKNWLKNENPEISVANQMRQKGRIFCHLYAHTKTMKSSKRWKTVKINNI